MEKDSMLAIIARELGISRGTDIPVQQRARVIYSAAGRMALASLWDAGGEPVSLQHFKDRAAREVEALLALSGNAGLPHTEWAEIIYQDYLQTGCLCHEAYRLQPARESCCHAEGVTFLRGSLPGDTVRMSGLGLYQMEAVSEDGMAVYGSLTEMFHLSEQTLLSSWQSLVRKARWQEVDVSEVRVQFLRVKDSFTNGYWEDDPQRDGSISLMRMGPVGREQYFLYRFQEGRMQTSSLPDWRCEQKAYRRIAVGLLKERGTLPSITYVEADGLTKVTLGYLLPLEEQAFFRLYSWPLAMGGADSDFTRYMQPDVFHAMKALLEAQGYAFGEEKS